MRQFLNCILIVACLFFYSTLLYAQTLNADTLAKYHVSKILTYNIDSTSKKILTETYQINNQGKIAEKYTEAHFINDTTSYTDIYDTFKYTYDSNARLISYTSNSTNASFFPLKNNETKIQSTTLYRYKKVFFVVPWSNKTITFYHSKNNKTITKAYSKGKNLNTRKITTTADYKIEKQKIRLVSIPAFSKYKNREHYRRRIFKRGPGKKYFWQRHTRKTIFRTRSKLDPMGNTIHSTVFVKHYFHKPFKKPLTYSYEITYTYVYQGALLVSCTRENLNYIYIHMPKKTQKGNQSIGFESDKNIPKETRYEYTINQATKQ